MTFLFYSKIQTTKKYLFITCTYIIIIAICLLIKIPATKANNLQKSNLISVKLFSKEKKIDYICVYTHTTIKPLNKPLNPDERWQLKAQQDMILLYQKHTNIQHHLPKSVSLIPENNSPICIGLSKMPKRCYHGTLKLTSENNNLTIINQVPTIDYLHSTVASELPSGWPPETIKAQTVAIHSYLLHLLSKNKLIYDSTQNQFYGGSTYENPSYNIYINEVKDIVMVNKNNLPIEALYHSTCAGTTLNNESVFGGEPTSYLKAKPCKYDKSSNFAQPKVYEISKEKLLRLLHTKDIYFVRNKSDQLKSIQLDNKTFTPYQFWLKLGQILGWGSVPGVKYNIHCYHNTCKISSIGAGHAVGLCQWGAKGMAEIGFKYTDILRYYYTNILFLKSEKLD